MQGHGGDRKLLLFSVGPVACCADSFAIHRIIDPPAQLVHLPGRSHHPAIFRHEGRLVTVLDVRSLFGLDPGAKRQQPEKLIITEIDAVLYGFWVDEVQSIISAGGGKWGMLPGVVPRTLFDAAFNYQDQLVLHIDFSRLIHAEATSWIDASGLFPVEEEPAEVAESSISEAVADTGKALEKQNEVISEKLLSPVAETHTRASVQQPVKAKPVPTIRPVSRKPPKVPTPIPKLEIKSKRETGQIDVSAPGSRTRSISSSSGAHQSEPASSHHQPVVPGSSAIFVMGWLIIAVILIGLLLYVLWPDTVQSLAERPVSSSQVIIPETPAYGGALPAPIASVTNAEVPPPALSEDSEPEKWGDGVRAIKPSSQQPESLPEETSSGIDEEETPVGPHATIERQGHMVTITLREAQVQTADELAPIAAQGIPDSDDETSVPQLTPEQALTEEASVAERSEQKEDSGIMISEAPSQTDAGPVVAAPPPLAPHARSEEIIHIVVKGDTLWDIAQRYIHDPYRYPELARLSNIKNPDLIYPGDRVRILIIRY
jgi:chemotaxis signal transduction protein/LysM repeat protein